MSRCDFDYVCLAEDGKGFRIRTPAPAGRSGGKCLKVILDPADIRTSAGRCRQEEEHGCRIRQNILLHAGERYTLSAWYKTVTDGTLAAVSVSVVSEDGREVAMVSGPPAGNWANMSATFTPAAEANRVELALTGAGIVCFDDISVLDGRGTEQIVNGGFEEDQRGWHGDTGKDQEGSFYVTNQKFTPWGLNYDRSIYEGGDYILEEMLDLSLEKVDRDFMIARDLGANVLRIFLQAARYEPEVGVFDEKAFRKLDKVVTLARKRNLRLDITGLSHIDRSSIPAWYGADDETILRGESLFWGAVAERYRDEPAVFCFNLQNEPFINDKDSEIVTIGSFTMRGGREFSYCNAHFKSVETLWREERGTDESDPHEYVNFRETLAGRWVESLTGEIRRNDQNHLVTLGFLPNIWSTGFSPDRIAGYLDFVCAHLYPERPASTGDPFGENLAWLRFLLGLFDTGKPIVVEEWFALGKGLEASGRTPVEWFDAFLGCAGERSAGALTFYHSMLADEGEADDPWLARFRAVADLIRDGELAFQMGSPPTVHLDRRSFLTEEAYREEKFRQYMEGRPDVESGPKSMEAKHREYQRGF